MQLIIELPPRDELMARNRERWAEVLADRTLAELPYKIETNAHGQILMTPPASGSHSYLQGEIAYQLRRHLGGRALPECPVSTIDGIRAADVGWYTDARFAEVKDQLAFERAPEICVEVVSPSNTDFEPARKPDVRPRSGTDSSLSPRAAGERGRVRGFPGWLSEITEKRQLYFEAGAEEVWLCQLDGDLTFYTAAAPDTPAPHSPRCPEFPNKVP